MDGIVYFNSKINNGIEGTINLIQRKNYTTFQINLKKNTYSLFFSHQFEKKNYSHGFLQIDLKQNTF